MFRLLDSTTSAAAVAATVFRQRQSLTRPQVSPSTFRPVTRAPSGSGLMRRPDKVSVGSYGLCPWAVWFVALVCYNPVCPSIHLLLQNEFVDQCPGSLVSRLPEATISYSLRRIHHSSAVDIPTRFSRQCVTLSTETSDRASRTFGLVSFLNSKARGFRSPLPILFVTVSHTALF